MFVLNFSVIQIFFIVYLSTFNKVYFLIKCYCVCHYNCMAFFLFVLLQMLVLNKFWVVLISFFFTSFSYFV